MNSSVEDPRLRLLGSQTVGGAQESATQVLRRLDETEVAVSIAADADHPARVAVAAFVTMIARLVPRVIVDDPAGDAHLPNNWWQATSWADLLERLTAVRPATDLPATRRIKVGFGIVEPVCDVYVGGGDWNVVLADHPVVMETGIVHGLGLHATGCLAVSQVLIKVLADLGFPGVEAATAGTGHEDEPQDGGAGADVGRRRPGPPAGAGEPDDRAGRGEGRVERVHESTGRTGTRTRGGPPGERGSAQLLPRQQPLLDKRIKSRCSRRTSTPEAGTSATTDLGTGSNPANVDQTGQLGRVPGVRGAGPATVVRAPTT